MSHIDAEILLLDDESESLEYSCRIISRFVNEGCVHTAETVEEALGILQAFPIGMAFLDIELTQSNGFELCEYIHREYPSVAVVMLTGHVDLGAKSYDYEPFDFLVKPVDILRLERTFERFRKRRPTEERRIMLDTKTGITLIRPADIVYIEKRGNICEIHCAEGVVHQVASTLDRLEATLSEKRFFRTHQSYLVPIERILRVNASKLGSFYEAQLDDGTKIPVSRMNYTRLKEKIMKQSMRFV